MIRHFEYSMPKTMMLNVCKNVLEKLDYEIDVYAPESDIVITKPIKIRRIFRPYDYRIYIQITDHVEVYIALELPVENIYTILRGAEKNILESSPLGSGIIVQQAENAIPFRLQKKIFTPLGTALEKENLNSSKIGE